MSKILDIVHDMARDLFEVGAMDKITMREMEALCLRPKRSFDPKEIKRIRTKNRVSQAVFAAFLGTGKTTVQQWEQGVKNQAALHNGSSISSTDRGWQRSASDLVKSYSFNPFFSDSAKSILILPQRWPAKP